MSDNDSSDDEYEVMRQVSIARKAALFAEMGLNTIASNYKDLIAAASDCQKPRKRNPRKVSIEALPSRRSARIEKKLRKVKTVKGFVGFKSPRDSGEKMGVKVEHDEITVSPNKMDDVEMKSGEISRDNMIAESVAVEKYAVENCVSPDAKNSLLENDKVIKAEEPCQLLDALENKHSEESASKTKENVDSEDNIVSENTMQSEGDHKVADSEVSGLNDFVNDDENALVNCVSSYEKNPLSENEGELLEIKETCQHFDTPWDERSEEMCLEVIKRSVEISGKFSVVSSDESSDSDWSSYEEIKFVISKYEDINESNNVKCYQMSLNDSCDDNDHDQLQRKKLKTYHFLAHDVPVLSCEDVTEEMLANIAKRSSGKVYDQHSGTTCHQCRQKTSDTKTVCRSGKCSGVRGMFCGVCLPKRYGENVADALRNPLWECPVCRGICNCSFCRTRAGKDPTGILYPEAVQHGYSSVAEYLEEKEKNTKKKSLKVLYYHTAENAKG